MTARTKQRIGPGDQSEMYLARALEDFHHTSSAPDLWIAIPSYYRGSLLEPTHVTTVLVTHDQEEAMDVADQIVVMSHGKVEQTGQPRDLYDEPSNEFVMSFLGPVNRVDQEFSRPHDIELLLEPNGTTEEAMIERIVHLGFEVRVELVRHDGKYLWSQISSDEAEQYELAEGQIVFIRPKRTRVLSSV